jgi:hypothetical protein
MKNTLKKNILLAFFLITGTCVKAQVNPLYYSNFDGPNDTLGWSHHAISGTDDWIAGTPAKYYFYANSYPTSWVTKLTGKCAINSERVLETPFYNLTDTSAHYVLSFMQQRYKGPGDNFFIEYSVDKGNSWLLLDNVNAKKKNWQTANGYLVDFHSGFQHSAINLHFIEGQDSVKFRFRIKTNSSTEEGWVIDNFSIAKEYYNIQAFKGDTIKISKNCPSFTVKTDIGFSNQYGYNTYNTTQYYLSNDAVLDGSDVLIGTKAGNINDSYINYSKIISPIPNLGVGFYYIIYKYDALDTLAENNENDNVSYAVLQVDSLILAPYVENFENPTTWRTYPVVKGNTNVWELGNGYRHHLEGAHSGVKAWHTSKTIYDNTQADRAVESPYIDLTADTGNLILSFWYKSYMDWTQVPKVEYRTTCDDGGGWAALSNIPYETPGDDWTAFNVSLATYSNYNNIRFRVLLPNGYSGEGIAFDDIYIGAVKPDLSIELDKGNRFTSSSVTIDSIKYQLFNSGLTNAPPTSTSFFWSTDSILDGSDIFLGTKQEPSLFDTTGIWTSFTFTKPTTNTGKYYVFYRLDSSATLDEMREYNNMGNFVLYQENTIAFPYYNDFETQITGWRHNSSLGNDDWKWTSPNKPLLNAAFSGSKVMLTNDTGIVSPMSRMHLYSPVFNLSTALNPVLEFDMKLFGNMNMSYSIDGGATWTLVDTANQSYNLWYYPTEYKDLGGIDGKYYSAAVCNYLFKAMSERVFVEQGITYGRGYNGRDADRNTHYVLDLTFLAGNTNIQFRYNLASVLSYGNQFYGQTEGALIDNFSIKEKFIDMTVNHKKSLMISSLSQKIKFFMQIKNQGNYITAPGITKFYLSTDTLLSGGDYFLGQENIPAIRPDLNTYFNSMLNAPGNLPSYSYLLYEVDATNTNAESNEANNVGYWPLALDSISTYPYLQNFNDSIIDGWNHYVTDKNGNYLKNQFRFRNMVAVSEVTYQRDQKSGEMFTDPVNTGASDYPIWYLESPAFDLSNPGDIFLSFGLMCTGSVTFDGGNFQYSIDGGNTWTLLTTITANQYDFSPLQYLNGEAGWSRIRCHVGFLDSTAFDITSLLGQQHVGFRFKYHSRSPFCGDGTVQGMRIDNFTIGKYNIDYIALDSMKPIVANYNLPILNLAYDIKNNGSTGGKNSITKFYWSVDNILDAGDPLIKTSNENPIGSGDTLHGMVSIQHPQQTPYYIFYKTDETNNNIELDETNNVGSFHVSFTGQTNYLANLIFQNVNALVAQPAFNATYSIVNTGGPGLTSKTNLYWSPDSLLDISDQNILSINNEVPILAADTLISTLSITYPGPVTQKTYFLFYEADVNDTMNETNETDNIGSFRVIFDYVNAIPENLTNDIMLFGNGHELYINQLGSTINTFELNMVNALGQTVHSASIQLSKGNNRYAFPSTIPPGLYIIILTSDKNRLIGKTIVENY